MSIRDLYLSRCQLVDNQPKPVFWQPKPLQYHPVCLYSDTTKQGDALAEAMVRRLIGLGLELEIEVGTMVLSGLQQELPKADSELVLLLKSNSADEARHYNGFQYAKQTYGCDTNAELQQLAKDWKAESDKQHPIHIAGVLEVGVFLISLGLLRIVGSPSLSRLAMAIAEDEFRHVQTNQAVSSGLGFWSNASQHTNLIDATLDWIWGEGLNDAPQALTLDNLKRFSRELLTDLSCPEFDKLTWYSFHHLPFELANDYIYSDKCLE